LCTCTLSLHDALPILEARWQALQQGRAQTAARSTLDLLRSELQQLEGNIQRAIMAADATAALHTPEPSVHRRPWRASDVLAQLRSEEHTSELQSRENL